MLAVSHPLWACPCSRCVPLRLYVCSSAGELSEAGPRLHAPPWSKPLGLGSQVALRGADSVGPAFCALPRTKQLRCLASTVSATYRLSRLCCSVFWVFAGVPSLGADDCPEPPEVLVSKEACLRFGRQSLTRAAIAPFQPLRLWLPVTGGGWSAAGYFCSVLCSVRGPGGVLCSSFSCGSYPTVWSANPS